MGLSRAVAHAFYGTRAGLREAQELSIEPLLAGRDTLVVAGTGSGKTEAVIAPIVDRYLANAHDAPHHVTVLYVSPTKALANDIAARLSGPLEQLGLSVGRRHGDRNDLKRKTAPAVLITTPESLDIELVRKQAAYRGIKAVIVDEVHQLVGTQRGLQLCLLLARLESWLGYAVQAAGMSATLANPAATWAQLRPGRTCDVLSVTSHRERRFVLRREQSRASVAELLRRTSSRGKVLVFAGSRTETESLAASIGLESAFGRRVYVHHSSLDVSVREQVEADLKGRDATLCIATSTLELGIDIGDINLVVLVGAPSDWRSFEQRIGRTNRRGDRTDVIGVVPPRTETPVFELACFLGLIGQANRELRRDESTPVLVGAVAQQAVSAIRQSSDWTPLRQLEDLLTTAPGIARQDVVDIVESLVDGQVLARHPVRNSIGVGERLEKVEADGEAWSNFPSVSQVVNLFEQNRRIGEAPGSPHNRQLLEKGKTVVFNGRPLYVERVVRGQEAHLRPSASRPDGELRFGGNAPIRDPYLIVQLPVVFADPRCVEHLATAESAWWREAAAHLNAAVRPGELPTWRSPGGTGQATFAGLWVNKVLLAASTNAGTAGEAIVYSDAPIDPGSLPDFDDLDTVAVSECPRIEGLTSWQKLLPPRLLAAELLAPWRTDPIYRESWERIQASQIRVVADDRLSALG